MGKRPKAPWATNFAAAFAAVSLALALIRIAEGIVSWPTLVWAAISTIVLGGMLLAMVREGHEEKKSAAVEEAKIRLVQCPGCRVLVPPSFIDQERGDVQQVNIRPVEGRPGEPWTADREQGPAFLRSVIQDVRACLVCRGKASQYPGEARDPRFHA
jgi:hypothetical protein